MTAGPSATYFSCRPTNMKFSCCSNGDACSKADNHGTLQLAICIGGGNLNLQIDCISTSTTPREDIFELPLNECTDIVV
uniref:Uncharacterized protein n=1 Tax=Oryza brachyantha TaxID=4533 RepID=J3NC15_ORYBR